MYDDLLFHFVFRKNVKKKYISFDNKIRMNYCESI